MIGAPLWFGAKLNVEKDAQATEYFQTEISSSPMKTTRAFLEAVPTGLPERVAWAAIEAFDYNMLQNVTSCDRTALPVILPTREIVRRCRAVVPFRCSVLQFFSAPRERPS
jgi:hypothetical protein